MNWPFQAAINAWRLARTLPIESRGRLERLRIRLDHQAANPHWITRVPLPLARFVALDLETTGPNMRKDRIISIGAVVLQGRAVRHDEAFEMVLQQQHSSEVENILVHQIGGQQQLAGADPRYALMDLLEFIGESVVIAWRAEFDETVLGRELAQVLSLPQQHLFIDLAVLLPAGFPATENNSLDDWIAHFGLRPIGRHTAIADAYMNAQLMLLALERMQRNGMATVGELIETERAQRWLGKRH